MVHNSEKNRILSSLPHQKLLWEAICVLWVGHIVETLVYESEPAQLQGQQSIPYDFIVQTT